MIEDKVRVGGFCPLCKSFAYVDLSTQEARQLAVYQEGTGLIQDLMPDTDRAVREFLRGIVLCGGGYCRECMGDLFGCTSRKIRFTKEAV